MLFDPQYTFWRRQPLCFGLNGMGLLALTPPPPRDVVVAEVVQRAGPVVRLYKTLGGGWKE